VHYIDPHAPYRPPEDAPASFSHKGRVPMELQRIQRFQHEPGLDDALAYVDRYDEEIAYVDAEVGRLLDGLAAHHEFDSALVILTADHGESMIERERWFAHGYQVYEEIIRVPLLIRGPGVKAGRRAGPVSLIDLAPTVLRFVGSSTVGSLPGVSLQRAPASNDGRIVFAEGGSDNTLLRAAIQGDRKWVVRVQGGERTPDRRVAFDLGTDPDEQAPLTWSDEPAAQVLLEITQNDPDPGGRPAHLQRGVRIDAPKVDPRADANALERLRALGYTD
jgi:arylsulfatase A-like enzyme